MTSLPREVWEVIGVITAAALGFIASRGRIRNEATDVFNEQFKTLAAELDASRKREEECLKRCDAMQLTIAEQQQHQSEQDVEIARLRVAVVSLGGKLPER